MGLVNAVPIARFRGPARASAKCGLVWLAMVE
jgi:hypothetical protein